ncbi:transglutaminase-like domain-containing protein [Paludicola sp. MB14-C6]|uniref:transglutaminase-like domain-containing protein n=1 Tax=Paludihabitans sp. MB14-C6 TaxID=3070656 RepID=UPI0027DE48F7|nr:transglutaminase-like domain-containing protein [Paludicola sp. MB14-C6]WMJ22320.1 transglutaminase-like domain-containing protein [Paludicola sp. MB14-C6]
MRSKINIILVLFIIISILTSCVKLKPTPDISSINSSSSKEQSSSEASSSEVSSSSSEVSSQTSSSKPDAASSKNQQTNSTKQHTSSKSSTDFSWDKGGNYSGSINIHVTSSPKTTVLSDANAMIDISNVSEGYITASYTGSAKRLKLQVKKDGKTYNYDLNNQGGEETFPLQLGNGDYEFRIMENVTGTQYIQLFSGTASVSLNNSFSPFLYPNQYSNYNASSNAVKKSFDLCMNASNDLDKVKSVYNYIITNVKYDYPKASSVQSGYLPNVDNTLATKKGICFDYAALMAAMLRAQNIPTKLVVGDVAPNGVRHAWNDVYIKGRGWITVGIQSDGSQWKRLDATFSSSNQADISNFINNSSNYTTLRIY